MKPFLFGTLLVSLFACHTPEAVVSTTFFNKNTSYVPYQKILDKYSRSTTVFSNYETLYTLNSALFSSEFYDAFRTEERERFHSKDMLLNVQKNASVFVSIFSPAEHYNDLTNDKIWEFTLTIGDKTYTSKSVKKVKDKDAWYSFFPFMNRWSSDYFVHFEIPDAENLPENSQFNFSLSNSQARTVMTF